MVFASLFRAVGASAPSTEAANDKSSSTTKVTKPRNKKRNREETNEYAADCSSNKKRQHVKENRSSSRLDSDTRKKGGNHRDSSLRDAHDHATNGGRRKNHPNKKPFTSNAKSQQRKPVRKASLEEALAFSAKLKDLSTKKRLHEALTLYWDPSNKDIRDGHHASIMVDCCSRCGAVEVSFSCKSYYGVERK